MHIEENRQNRFQILSLDGGGIKGLFSAAVLAAIEEDLGIRVTDHFDLITGTSTGGIIAIGLASGLRPREIVSFYVNEGPRIFRESAAKNLAHYWRAKHENKALKDALRRVVRDKLIGDCVKRLVVPAYNLDDGEVYLFKTPHHPRLRRDWRVPLWKVAMATSAAPTFLECCKEVDNIRMVDGGLWANNPTMVGIVEAMAVLDVPRQSISSLSIGCTNSIENPSSNLDSGGLLQWRKAAIDCAMRGQSHGIQGQAALLLGKERAIRIDPAVTPGLFEIDKLNEQQLLSKAANVSRCFAPEFKEKFSSHVAEEFLPIYSTSQPPKAMTA